MHKVPTQTDPSKPGDTGDRTGGLPATASIAPLRVLKTCGWLTEWEAADARLRIDTLNRSHQVVRVTAPDGRSAIVKQPLPEARYNGRNLDRELYVYRLAGWIEALKSILPAPYLIDERHQLLACECLPVGGSWPDDIQLDYISTRGVAAQLGAVMAGWHRATQGIAMEPSPAPGIMYLSDALETAIQGRSESAQLFLRSLAADATFGAAFREGATLYKPAALIHGDIRPDNWNVRRDRGNILLKVFDWELAGLGDPAWDVASVVAEAMIEAIRTGSSGGSNDRGWPLCAVSTIHEFVEAYVANQPMPGMDDTAAWRQVALYIPLRLLHVASEWSEYAHNLASGLVERMVDHARTLLHTRQHAAETLATMAHV